MFPALKAAILFLAIGYIGDAAAMYQCRDEHGKTSFQDQPCSKLAVDVKKPLQEAATPPLQIGSPAHRAAVASELERQLKAKTAERAARPKVDPANESASQGVRSTSESMPFDRCIVTVSATIRSTGAARVFRVLTTPKLHTTRICTTDGSVLISCSALDEKMITTISPHC